MPTSSPPTPFPLYLLPSLPFRRRRRQSSLSTTSTSPTASPSTSPQAPSYLSRSPTAYLQCYKCLTDLIPITSIISKGFTGRHGRAYLVSPPAATTPALRALPAGDLPNTHTHKPVPRQLVTGAHTVADISCKQCGSVLGWKYVEAEEESQRYKVGKFILETKRVVRAAEWDAEEREWEGAREEERVEFDSQDEDECEDLFAGVWSQGLARRRRARGRARPP